MAYALSDEYRAKARYLLGYSMLTSNFDPRTYLPAIPAGLQDGSAVFENSVRSVLDESSYNLVVSLVDQIMDFRDKIGQAMSTLIADRIDGAVTLNKNRMDEMWREDHRLCTLLASLLMIRIYYHPYNVMGGYGTIKVQGG